MAISSETKERIAILIADDLAETFAAFSAG
jgi:hypothetical protein